MGPPTTITATYEKWEQEKSMNINIRIVSLRCACRDSAGTVAALSDGAPSSELHRRPGAT